MSMRDILDQLADGFGKAIADIRHELVDRGWFGREKATPQGQEPTMADTLGWTTHAEREKAGISEPERCHQQDREHAFDR